MNELITLGERAVAHARKAGASDVVASLSQRRETELRQREGKLERVEEAASRSLSLGVFVDGRYSTHTTSDLRWEAIAQLIEEAIPMTRLLEVDPHRVMTPPELYPSGTPPDLDAIDASLARLTPETRRETVAALEAAAWGDDRGALNAVSASYSDTSWASARVSSNGFVGEARGTRLGMAASVSVKDPDGRRPSAWSSYRAVHAEDMLSAAEIGRDARERALARIGQMKLSSRKTTLVVENRVGSKLLSHLLRPLYGGAIQQDRSFLKDAIGEQIAAAGLTLIDDPLLARGQGSRHYDGDGIASRRRTLIDAGVLKSQLFDVYTAHKMGVSPTGGSTSNVLPTPGERGLDALLTDVREGIFVTGFLGGNSDTNTGDFSYGISGFEIVDGALGRPIGEMNITGSHALLWKRLVAIGADPWRSSSWHTPSMVFEDVSVSGT